MRLESSLYGRVRSSHASGVLYGTVWRDGKGCSRCTSLHGEPVDVEDKLGWLLIDDLDVDDGVRSEPAGTYVGDSLGRETGAAIGERIGPSVVGMKRNRPCEEWAA